MTRPVAGSPRGCTSLVQARQPARPGPAPVARRLWMLAMALAMGSAAAAWHDFSPSAAWAQAPVAAEVVTKSPAILHVEAAGHTGSVRGIAFTSDGALLCTAGMDKVARVWRVPAQEGAAPTLERVARWDIDRGLRGAIHALACSADGRLALGGFSARATSGDIYLARPRDGAFAAAYEGHRESISHLAFSASGRRLISTDVLGRTLLWSADGKFQQLVDVDAKEYGADAARYLAAWRWAPPSAAIVGDRWAAAPRFAARGTDSPLWRLDRFQLRDGARLPPLEQRHYGAVSALAASADGRLLASADIAGHVHLWDVEREPPVAELVKFAGAVDAKQVALSLSLSAEGEWLAIGLQDQGAGGALILWNVAERRVARRRALPGGVTACALSPDGRFVAYNGGREHDVYFEPTAGGAEPTLLPGGRRVRRVGLARADDPHRLLLEFTGVEGEAWEFDPKTLKFERRRGDAPPPPARADAATRDGWRIDVAKSRDEQTEITLTRGGAVWGTTRLDPEQGQYMCHAWLLDEAGKVDALAVGTDRQNNCHVFSLRERALPPLRVFRGHLDRVTSLAQTGDRRYLVSGGADGVTAYWSLDDLRDKDPLRQRWGASLAAAVDGVEVGAMLDVGPLFQRGARSKDRLVKIGHVNSAGAVVWDEAPDAILRRLAEVPLDTQVSFFSKRSGAEDPPPFNLRPQWHATLMLYCQGADWVAWTPRGYYACSAGGEDLVGWQLNGGFGKPPEFFGAERFRDALHRPDAIQRLLPEGSLERALTAAPPHRASTPLLVDNPGGIAPPKVRITKLVDGQGRDLMPSGGLGPEAKIVLTTSRLTLGAAAATRTDHRVKQLKLVLNGSAPREHAKALARRFEVADEWTFDLRPGRHVLAVQADADVVESRGVSETLLIEYKPEQARPALYALVIGVSDYPDELKLDWAASDAGKIGEALETTGKSLFDKIEIKMLVDKQATRAGVEDGLAWLENSLEQGDTGLLFFSGHGVRAKNQGQDKFHLAPVDVDLGDIPATCVSEDRLKAFCEKRAGKGHCVLMIDACHSGAFRVDELALALKRSDYGAVTYCSSQGEEKSLEHPDLRGGVFTFALVEGLRGAADLYQDNDVNHKELDLYLGSRVPERVRQLSPTRTQNPVAAYPPLMTPIVLSRRD